MPLTEPGAASVTPVPIAIEHAEPGGVSWTKRRSWYDPSLRVLAVVEPATHERVEIAPTGNRLAVSVRGGELAYES